MNVHILDLWQHGALHDRPAFVVLDIADPAFSRQSDLLGEALLFEVSHGIIIRIGEEMIDRRVSFPDVILERVHQMRAVTLDRQSRPDCV